EPLLQQGHEAGRNVQARASAGLSGEVIPDEQSLEAGDVVEVDMGEKDRRGKAAIPVEEGRERLLAAVHHEQGRAVAFQDDAGRAEFHGGGVADPEEMERVAGYRYPVHEWMIPDFKASK